MVRKDVKIGAIVVAILIAVLIVYVLVVPGGDAGNIAGNGVDDATLAAQMLQPENVVGSTTPGGGAPAASNAPATVQNGAANGQQLAGGAPAGKTDPFGTPDERWMLALNTGSVPAETKLSGGNAGTGNAAGPIALRGSGTDPAGPRVTPTNTRPPNVAGNSALALDPAARSGGSTGMRTHVVQPGENIARIAENVYGSQVYYKQILAANPGIKPEKMRPGVVLNLPDVKEVKGSGGADDDSPAPALDAQTEYRVQSGDSMHKIATKLYGKADMWEQIYDLNKAKIGDDPAKLKLGMILKLPVPPTQR